MNPPPPPLLRLANICKRFGELRACDRITLELQRGEVLALLGENGAGKSTLVSILFGHYLADTGRVEVDGQPLPPGDTRAAIAAGIGMVHQHFTLAENLSVLDNVMLGTEPLWQPFSRRADARRRLLDAAQRFGLAVDPEALVASLSVGERQRVEILKALVSCGRRRGARILVLDEPTAVLTPLEAESLFATLRRLVDEGLSVIFISHKLDEVLRVSQRIAVLRGGKLVTTVAAASASKARLAEWMVGHEVAPPRKRSHTSGGVVCALRDATLHRSALRSAGWLRAKPATGEPNAAGAPAAPPDLRGLTSPDSPAARTPRTARPLLDTVTLQVHEGEIVAIAGVAGNGQQALAEVLGGGRALDTGQVMLRGRHMRARPRDWVEAGVARVPEDRHVLGVVGDMALWENLVLERYATRAFSRWGVLRRARAASYAQRLVQRFGVRGAASVHARTAALSGGNLQKLILARALAGDPDALHTPPLIVANQPTWGLDVGAVAEVHQRLLDACAKGSAVLLISEDLDEVFALADRIAVMHQGRLSDALPTRQWTLARIGLAMAGQAFTAEALLSNSFDGPGDARLNTLPMSDTDRAGLGDDDTDSSGLSAPSLPRGRHAP